MQKIVLKTDMQKKKKERKCENKIAKNEGIIQKAAIYVQWEYHKKRKRDLRNI
jgi:hypothetical protein